MGIALKELRGKVKPRVRTATICVNGDLWTQYDELTDKLNAMLAQQGMAMMGANPDLAALQEQIAAVEAAMRDEQVSIDFRGISTYKLEEIKARFPSKDGRGWDVNAGAAALIAACAVEPTTEAEAQELLEQLNVAEADKLWSAAWEATTRSEEIPFSVRASAQTSGSGSK